MVEFQQCCPECPYHFIVSTEIEKAQHPLSWIFSKPDFLRDTSANKCPYKFKQKPNLPSDKAREWED